MATQMRWAKAWGRSVVVAPFTSFPSDPLPPQRLSSLIDLRAWQFQFGGRGGGVIEQDTFLRLQVPTQHHGLVLLGLNLDELETEDQQWEEQNQMSSRDTIAGQIKHTLGLPQSTHWPPRDLNIHRHSLPKETLETLRDCQHTVLIIALREPSLLEVEDSRTQQQHHVVPAREIRATFDNFMQTAGISAKIQQAMCVEVEEDSGDIYLQNICKDIASRCPNMERTKHFGPHACPWAVALAAISLATSQLQPKLAAETRMFGGAPTAILGSSFGARKVRNQADWQIPDTNWVDLLELSRVLSTLKLQSRVNDVVDFFKYLLCRSRVKASFQPNGLRFTIEGSSIQLWVDHASIVTSVMQKASHSTKVCGTVWKHHYTSTSRSCTTFENSLHNGRELTLLDLKPLDLENSFSGVSVEECGNTCLQAAQVGCDGFSFHPTTGSTSGRCVLHGYGAVSKNAESSTLISGKCRIVDNLGDARCSPSVPGSHSGSVFWISDFVPSRDLCSELCARNVSCSAFSFAVLPDSSFGRCSLHRLGKVSNRMFGKQKAVVGTCDRTSTCQLHEPREHSRGISDRYLVYQPQFGLGNQVISLGVAVVWAQALSRVLVVPHFFSPRATSDVVADHAAWISYRELFDIQYLRSRYADLTIIEMDEFLKWNPSAKPIRVENTNLGKSTAVEWSTKYFQMLNFPDAEVSHMPGLFNTMTPEEVSVAFGGCGGIQTLAFMSIYHNILQTPAFDDELVHLTKPSAKTSQILSRISQQHLASGPGSVCLHIRRGDFKEYCDELNAQCSLPWFKKLRADRYACYPPITVFQKFILQLTTSNQNRNIPTTIILLTDEPSIEKEFRQVAPKSQFVTEESIKLGLEMFDISPEHSDAFVAIIQQQICALAETVVLTKVSTFSKTIARIRKFEMQQNANAVSLSEIQYWKYEPNENHLEACQG